MTRPGSGQQPPGDEESILREYLGVLWRRKWMVVALVIVCTLIGYGVSAVQPDMYQSSAELIYEASLDVSNPLSDYGTSNVYERDLEIRAIGQVLGSPEVVKSAEERMARRYDGEFVSHGPDASASEGASSYAVEALVPSADNERSIGSDIVSVVATSTDPALAAVAANSYAEAFVEWRADRQRRKIEIAVKVVKQQLTRYGEGTQESAEFLILKQRLLDLQTLYGTATGNYRVLVPAQPAGAPYAPRPLRSAVLGFGIGLFAGIGVAFLLEQLDTRIHRPDEVAAILRQPVLGRIPKVSRRTLAESALVTMTQPDSHAAEAFRVVRTNLDFMAVDADVRSLVITSCSQGEGKSVTAANLAVAIALGGRRVIVVDGDLRRPRVHTYFNLANQQGVTTVVTAKSGIEDALQPVALGAGIEEGDDALLRVLPSGPMPPNPGEIVASRRFGELVRELEQHADLVLVDTPAMMAVGDTAAIAAKVDGLVFLVDLQQIRRPLLQQAADQLSKLPVKQMGIIIRGDGSSAGRYGYYGYRYTDDAEQGRPTQSRRTVAGVGSKG
jgi:capsular exopolysaccharide synthesis family protein